MGIPEPQVTWYRDGKIISHGGRFTITIMGGSVTLIVKSCRAEDSGLYKCEATNKSGTAGTTAQLTVEGKRVIENLLQ